MNNVTTRLFWPLSLALVASLGLNTYQAWKLNCPGCADAAERSAAPVPQASGKMKESRPAPSIATQPVAGPPAAETAPPAGSPSAGPADDAAARPVFMSPGNDEALPEQPEGEKAKQNREWLSAFDRAMDREYSRLEEREKSPRDADDLRMIQQLKAKLAALDDLYIRADNTTAAEDRFKLDAESQQLMGEIIQMGRADRNQLLSKLARSYGVAEEAQVVFFIQAIDQIYADTHLDWAKLFSRGP